MTLPTTEDIHDPAHFADMYAGDADPWGFESRWYERRKYALTLASLPRPRYRRAVEPGCANGALTEMLADRCEELHAFDLVPTVVARARSRLHDRTHVQVAEGVLPDHWPSGSGDLVVWSEVAYYLGDTAADRAIAGLDGWLEPGGDLVAVHWTGDTNYPRTGAAIGPWLDAVPFLSRLVALTDEEFALGVWRRTT